MILQRSFEDIDDFFARMRELFAAELRAAFRSLREAH
jgi:hypothetical protein